MYRFLIYVLCAALPLAVIAADDDDNMDWEATHSIEVDSNDELLARRLEYLRDVLGIDPQLIGLDEVLEWGLEGEPVPEDREVPNLDTGESHFDEALIRLQERDAAERAVPSVDDFEDEEEDRLRHEAWGPFVGIQWRIDRALYGAYATPAEMERVVPDLGLEDDRDPQPMDAAFNDRLFRNLLGPFWDMEPRGCL